MSFASPVFPIAIALLVLLAGWAIAAKSAWYAQVVARPEAGRYEAIDGLRGFLALGVFFTHAISTHTWYAEGRWDASLVPFCLVAGQAGVSLFFMITGFLFWSRVLRRRDLDTASLYAGRVRRLVPMYLVSVAASLAVIAAATQFTLAVEPAQLAREVRTWLAFGFMSNGEVNGMKEAHLVAPVYWTLAYEWGFYAALPFLALFARGPAFALLVAVAVFFGVSTPITLNFVAGALVALAAHRKLLDPRMQSPWLAPVPLAALAFVLSRDTAYSPLAVAALAVFFLFVAAGNPLGGLLRLRAAKVLGAVSYSFYLLHGTVLFVAFRLADAALPVATMTPVEHWSVAALAALATVALSAVTYRHVEHRFYAGRPVRVAPVPAFVPLG